MIDPPVDLLNLHYIKDPFGETSPHQDLMIQVRQEKTKEEEKTVD